MKYYIGPEGPTTAQLAIVAMKPGRDELQGLLTTGVGRPLIGATGKAVDRHLLKIGTSRAQVYLTNAVKNFDDLGDPTDADITREQVELYQELVSLPNLNCIVAMGAVALASLSNFHHIDITRRRGSILRSFLGTKMVPTFHPSFYMRGEWRFAPVVEFDLRRALEQSKFPELRLPTRTYYVRPSLEEAVDWLKNLLGKHLISFDIETLRPSYIRSIAFSSDARSAYCVPLTHSDRSPYWTLDQEIAIWKLIQIVLAQEKTQYISQNGMFDCWILWQHGIETPFMDTGFDTMYAHKLVAPDLPHSLAFIDSIYTEEPFYKDESGKWDSQVRVPDNDFWSYNCKDSATTLESALNMMEDMAEVSQLAYYRKYVQLRWTPLMNMQKRGMKVSREGLIDVRRALAAERLRSEDEIKSLIGWIPNTKSKKDMEKLLGDLHVKTDLTPTGKPKTNEESMLKYAREAPEDARRILAACLEVTRRRTLVEGFLSIALDDRGFYHPHLKLNFTVSGREAGEGGDAGGPQIQNIPKRLRRLFIPDDDESEITCADLKQAEAMVVAWEADDPLLIESFLQKKDAHSVFACLMYRGWHAKTLPPDDLIASIKRVCPRCEAIGETECVHSERYTAKISGHGFRYMMGINKFLSEQARRGIFLTFETAKRARDAAISDEIAKWHERVSLTLQKTRVLMNAFGRRREFYGLFDNAMIRDGVDWLAQSHVSHVNAVAYISLNANLPPGSRLLTQTHDSIAISNKKKDRVQVVHQIENAYNQTAVIHGRDLRIPIDITHGLSWGEQK